MGRRATACQHGITPKSACADCRREYDRVYARTVRRQCCAKCGSEYTQQGKKRVCLTCHPPVQPKQKPVRPPRTHCPYGHEKNEENWRHYGGGPQKKCVPCHKRLTKRYHDEHRVARNAYLKTYRASQRSKDRQ